MANITEEHLHHMAKRHHATMKKLDGIQAKVAARLQGFVGTLEVGAGSWLGGAIEGYTSGGTIMHVPYNLGLGAIFLAVGHLGSGPLAEWSSHANNVGNGLIGSYVAATGYAFGKNVKAHGLKGAFGGHSWSSPYETGPGVSGNLSEAQMAEVVQRMHAAANAAG